MLKRVIPHPATADPSLGQEIVTAPQTGVIGISASPHPFRQIYEEHFRFVWRALRRLGVRERDLMDLAQNVFLVVHKKLPEFEGRSKLRTWIFAICQRVASDYRRSAVIRREITTDTAEINRQLDGANLPNVEARRRVQLAEDILNRLPEKQRIVFMLFELEEMSGEDIAELLDVPIGTVRSRLRLAREAFRREVKRLGTIDARQREAV